MKTFDEFQDFACEKWFGPKEETSTQYFLVPTLGITGEAGEVAEKMKKFFRGDDMDLKTVGPELGDVLFYVAVLANRLGFTLSEVAQMEVDKINGRIERGTRRGDGDDR
jgi:NTP pyrophosphatase (non-canonical NTP hydrolase)